MPSLPRVITVDPTGTLARIVRAATDLMDMPVIQVDIPDGSDALEEVARGGINLVVSAWELYDDMKGLELALKVKQVAPATAIVILADVDDPEEFDDETQADSPFVYLRRPVDIHLFHRVLLAGLKGEDIFAAKAPPAQAAAAGDFQHGPVPLVDTEAARLIVDRLLADVGAMAVLFANRTGDTLLERGAVGYLNREDLTRALRPMVSATIDMGQLIGGQAQSLQFYDGEDKDVFVFSVGLHHYLCLVFDGQAGSRSFGIVNRYGRQAVQDLIALLGASAFMIQRQEVEAPARPQRKPKIATQEEMQPVILERPVIAPPEPEPLRFDPIQNLDLSILDGLSQLDDAQADDLFNPDRLAELANKGSGRKEVSIEEAIELGILPGNMDASAGAG